ncbi:hypothetical protein [Microbacterium sp. B24]|uniref:hypothetical protein n=1 Tax=Microbacterium sp. B24 TaxID=95616 RepID=UPI000428C524|nr:hypothetical protein [Microbacterium sp. B24]
MAPFFSVGVTTVNGGAGLGPVVVQAANADAAQERFLEREQTTIFDLSQSGLAAWTIQEVVADDEPDA